MQATERLESSTIQRLKECIVAIAHTEEDIFKLDIEKKLVENEIGLFNAELELEISTDTSLRDAEMKKAQKTISQATSQKYQELQQKLIELNIEITTLKIAVDRIKREYAIAKLETKLAIGKIINDQIHT